MSDYIKRLDVMNILHGGTFWTGLAKEIQNLPSADVVEVVRCKDCKHWNRERAKRAKIQFMGYCERFCGYCNKTDFCAWAERKDNE